MGRPTTATRHLAPAPKPSRLRGRCGMLDCICPWAGSPGTGCSACLPPWRPAHAAIARASPRLQRGLRRCHPSPLSTAGRGCEASACATCVVWSRLCCLMRRAHGLQSAHGSCGPGPGRALAFPVAASWHGTQSRFARKRHQARLRAQPRPHCKLLTGQLCMCKQSRACCHGPLSGLLHHNQHI